MSKEKQKMKERISKLEWEVITLKNCLDILKTKYYREKSELEDRVRKSECQHDNLVFAQNACRCPHCGKEIENYKNKIEMQQTQNKYYKQKLKELGGKES